MQYDNYYNDGRVRAGQRREDSPIKSIDNRKMLLTITVYDSDEDAEFETEVPFKYEVCPTCEGKGKHVNPSIDCNGLSAEDFYEDPDFAEEYMEGRYDVECYCCGGKKVVPVMDRERTDSDILKLLDEKERDDAEYRGMVEAERRMGC